MIRPSKPEDAKAVVPLIDIVFEEMEIPELMPLPKDVLYPVFEEAFLLPGYRYSYERTFVATVDDEVKGILVGYPHVDDANIDLPFEPLLKKLGVDNKKQLFTDQESYPGEWYLDTLAVAENAQGHGLGGQLIDTVAEIIKRRGETTMSLNVDQTNPRAQALYERHGFTKNGELMIGSHRYNHMVKAL